MKPLTYKKNNLDEFRKIVIKAIFSNDELVNRFVLKGGSALDLIYKITYRSSIDVDIAMEDDIVEEDMPKICELFQNALQETFNEHDPSYSIFQFKFEKRPFKQNRINKQFWGGYRIEFKIRKGVYPIHDIKDQQQAARQAEVVNPESQSKTFLIDISKYEYTTLSKIKELDYHQIRVYTLEMIVYEKLRAICQKLPDYEHAHPKIKARPKDFYDIYMIMKHQPHITFESLELSILEKFFNIKEVPLHLLFKISDYKTQVFDAGIDQLKETFLNNELKEFNQDEVFKFIIDGIYKIPNIMTINN